MGEGREDWKLRIAAKTAAKIKDGVEDCKSVCLKRDVVVSAGGRRKGKRGRGRTSRGVMSGRESIFTCTSLSVQCQSTIAIDCKKSVDNGVVVAQNVVVHELLAGPTLNRYVAFVCERPHACRRNDSATHSAS